MRDFAVVVRQTPARRNRGPIPLPALPAAGAAGPAALLWTATIGGEPTMRARMHEVVVTDGTARLIKSRPARVWQNAAMAQLLNRRPPRPLAGSLVLECRIRPLRRGDFDDALLIEVLERAAVIAHREQIREKHIFWADGGDAPCLAVRLLRAGDRP